MHTDDKVYSPANRNHHVKIQLTHPSTHAHTHTHTYQCINLCQFTTFQFYDTSQNSSSNTSPISRTAQHESHSTSMFLCTVPHNPALNRAVLKSPTNGHHRSTKNCMVTVNIWTGYRPEHSAVPEHHNVASTRRSRRCYFNIRPFRFAETTLR